MTNLKSLVKKKSLRNGAMRRLVFALTMAVIMCLIRASPTSAILLSSYFNIIYGPVTFDKSEVIGSDIFQADIQGRVICVNSPPVSVSEAVITSRIVAENATSGVRLILNPEVVLQVKPFPNIKDETFTVNETVLLQFPEQSEPGDYIIIGQFVEAKIKAIAWLDVSSFLPPEHSLGTIHYFNAQPQAPPLATPTPPSTTPTPPSATPTPPSTTLTSPSVTPPTSATSPPSPTPPPAQNLPTNHVPESLEHIVPWWAILVALAAICTTGIFIIRWLRHRHPPPLQK